MSLFRKGLVKLAGNHFIQNLLEKAFADMQYQMGIGSGDTVSCSGEEVAFSILKRRFQPPFCIFDVGANQGQFLKLILSQMTGKDFSVHCFEPSKETFGLLEKSIQADRRIKLNNLGIGKEKGSVLLHFDKAGSGLASLTKRRLDHLGIHFHETETVTIDTIDNYCAENAIRHIHLLKLDIEGHELDALAGARNMLENKSIDMVAFEFGGCNIDTRTYFQDFWYYFVGFNMNIFRITPSGYLFPIASYKEIYEQFRTTNYIAIKKT